MAKKTKLKKAVELYEDFTGHEASYIDEYAINIPDVAVKVGTLDGVLYTTHRDGVTESYIHKFKKSARPLLAVSSDGRQMVTVGGSYRFTDRGFIDR